MRREKLVDKMLEKLKKYPIVPVFYHSDLEYSKNIVRACYEGGLRVFEFTNRGADAFDTFKVLCEFAKKECPEMSLGIGTILTAEDAERFIAVGADFVVQPIMSIAVGEVCKKYNIPWLPAGMTTNEIYNAWSLGAVVVKVFPGNLVGPDYIKAVRGPLPFIPLMVTGGVEPTTESITSWLSAGVIAVGIGSQLFKGDFSNDFSPLVERCKVLVGNL